MNLCEFFNEYILVSIAFFVFYVKIVIKYKGADKNAGCNKRCWKR